MNTISTIFKRLFAASGVLLSTLTFGQYVVTNAFPGLQFDNPLEMTFPSDGTDRLFIVEQEGVIYKVNTSSPGQRSIFLDITSIVNSTPNEGGLLGLAFHPDFKTNGYFYVNYTKTISDALHTCISRFTVNPSNPDVAVVSSEKVILTYAQPFDNHNGGCIRFGKDGYLYISSGDGGSRDDPNNNGQSLNTLLGKILRIDVNVADSQATPYAIPTDNPFVTNESARPEIFAYGLRNPWKFSIDTVTGNIWAGDVGQGYREEVDLIQSGKNYGWRITEGFSCRGGAANCDKAGITMPVIDYEYNVNGNYSITGGLVYRGNSMPELFGKYIFGDFVSGRIYALDYQPGIDTSYVQIFDANFTISGFAEDQNKNIYAIGHNTGNIYKIQSALETSLHQGNTISDSPGNSIYPNPVQNEFIITVNLKEQQKTTINLVTFDGKEKVNLLQEMLPTGKSVLTFDGSQLTKGVYFIEIETGSVKNNLKMIKD